ncbi:unnamed protein product [Parajaminaea phylloscopi]
MNCLSWWLPLFLIPLPVCPPELLVLFVVVYLFKTRPCIHCALIVAGLAISTRYWTQLARWQPTHDPARLLRVSMPGSKTGFDLDLGFDYRQIPWRRLPWL